MSNLSTNDSLEERIKSYLRRLPHFEFTDNGRKNVAHRFDVSLEFLQSMVDAVQSERNNLSGS